MGLSENLNVCSQVERSDWPLSTQYNTLIVETTYDRLKPQKLSNGMMSVILMFDARGGTAMFERHRHGSPAPVIQWLRSIGPTRYCISIAF